MNNYFITGMLGFIIWEIDKVNFDFFLWKLTITHILIIGVYNSFVKEKLKDKRVKK